MQYLYKEVADRIEKALRYVDETKRVVIGEKNLHEAVSLFKECFPGRSAVMIADQNTFQVAGNIVQNYLESENSVGVHPPFLFSKQEFCADREHTDQIVELLKANDAVPIAVGSGTINDIVKLASYETGRAYMIVATAASMDGYTAYGASIQIDSFKQTRFCPAPLVVLVDMDIICQAPTKMNAAGYADLLAKIPAGADWILADLIGTEPIDRIAWDIVQSELRNWLREPGGIPIQDRKALLYLIEGLLMSGLAMQKAKSSRTASGAEHLFSHLWDNQHYTHHGIVPSHGFKVGIGTLVSSALYEKFLAMDSDQFHNAHQRALNAFKDWKTVEKEIRQAFPDEIMAEQVLRESRNKYVEKDEIERRFNIYMDSWKALQSQIKEQVLPVAKIHEMLKASEAPAKPEDIGIDRFRLEDSCRLAKMIRNRYNILDFTDEQGLWSLWIPAVVNKVSTNSVSTQTST